MLSLPQTRKYLINPHPILLIRHAVNRQAYYGINWENRSDPFWQCPYKSRPLQANTIFSARCFLALDSLWPVMADEPANPSGLNFYLKGFDK
jgi:hypothetical protein